MERSAKKIFIVAGEPSGDARAAELVREIKKIAPDTVFRGIGGSLMEKEGVSLIEHIKNLSVFGIWKALTGLPRIRAQFKTCVNEIKERPPDAAILIDYPGFNLALARFLKKNRIPVIYYIIPQVWAWGAGRVGLLKKYADKIFVIFDFEKGFLERFGVDSEFVGHPILDMTVPASNKKSGSFAIALLPGSRKNEIRDALPIMLEASRAIKDRINKKTEFTLAENSNVDEALYGSILRNYSDLEIKLFKNDTLGALAGTDFALVNSGTATLETAIMEKPMIILYDLPLLSRLLICPIVIKTEHIGLVNIIAGKRIVPEFVMDSPTAEKISKAALEIIQNPVRMEGMRHDLKKVKGFLGEPGAARRAAASITRFLAQFPPPR